ncbi:MFS transporter [Paenibacillus paeoniae]|uniref:MFS transporter n=1 Tax=Paenibacillus paeoniae TaxID=2292705 RepID=A0A371PHH7_9BACL|nr:MFS transporter [Paenibacillus paeoniae]REK75583.1 MFS transporter [Paenibacillus paeoniae]
MNAKKILWSMAFAQFLVMQVWFNFSAIMPVIEMEWGLTASQSGFIIASFQVGYVVAIIIYSVLIEKYNPKSFFVYGAFVAGISGIAFAFFAQGFWISLLLRFLSGIGVAGIYVPGVRLLTGLFPPKERGKVIGIYVGSLVVGSGFSLFVSSLLLEELGWQGVILLTSFFSIVAACLVNRLKVPSVGISPIPIKIQWHVLKKVFRKQNLLVNGGYAGHSWELYAIWAWIGPFFVYYFTTKGFNQADAIQYGNMVGAIVIMIGGIATYLGGKLSDSIGRIKAANLFLFISITCSLSIGWAVSLPILLMLVFVLIYGFAIVADSPIYNVTVIEVSEPEIIGLSLGIQSVLGFAVTIFSPLVFGIVLQSYGWGMAFFVIGAGTLIAPICMLLLSKLQSSVDVSN